MFRRILFPLIPIFLITMTGIQLNAQNSNRMYRIAKIKVDGNQLEQYKVALKEQMNTAIKVEPGVLSYTVVAEKKIQV